MKKILPLILILGGTTIAVTGCKYNIASVDNNELIEIKDVVNRTATLSNNYIKTINSKYNIEYNDNLDNALTSEHTNEDSTTNNYNFIPNNDLSHPEHEEQTVKENSIQENEQNDVAIENANELKETNITPYTNNTNINKEESFLYSIKQDINASCDEFCTLKQNLIDAISQTNDLINKINNKQIILTDEEKLQVIEQAKQLKSLNKQLSNSTTELILNLNNIEEYLKSPNNNENLTLKYLLVLDNLVNGNELLENSLNSLGYINSIIGNNPYNANRLWYGYQYNNNPPIIKDYSITKDGELVENKQDSPTNDNEVNDSEASDTELHQSRFIPNIDTYGNANSNIDSFFNTALLNNQFMYGNNFGMPGYGFQGYNNYYNPYLQQYAGYENSQKATQDNINSMNNEYTTQDIQHTHSHKARKIKKNVDTYKDDNTPTFKDRINKLKSGWIGIYSKFKHNKEQIKPEQKQLIAPSYFIEN